MAKHNLSNKQLETLRLVILSEAGEQVMFDQRDVAELCDLGLVEKGPESAYRVSFEGLRLLKLGSSGVKDDST